MGTKEHDWQNLLKPSVQKLEEINIIFFLPLKYSNWVLSNCTFSENQFEQETNNIEYDQEKKLK